MRNNRLHTPIGVGDILPEECRIKNEVTERVKKILDSYGYQQVETPMFEYMEVFSDEKMGSTNPKQMYKFFDRDGTTLALRSDITPAVARIAATAYQQSSHPLRFSYFGNAFRYNESYQGKRCEFTQAGIELLGIDCAQADAEVIALAVRCLEQCGMKEFKIHIGQVGFFKGILEESGLQAYDCKELEDRVAARNYVGVEELVYEKNITGSIRELFLALPNLVGKKDMIDYARTLTKNKNAQYALNRMEEILDILKRYHVEDKISFDLGMVNRFNYYTGIIFRGYTYGTGYSVVDGGRYDHLVEQFGKKMPAVGFGIKVNEIVSLLLTSQPCFGEIKQKALFASSGEGLENAISLADRYRLAGIIVENSLLGSDFDKNIEYALANGFEFVLLFLSGDKVKYARFVDSIGVMTVDTTVNELVVPRKECVQ